MRLMGLRFILFVNSALLERKMDHNTTPQSICEMLQSVNQYAMTQATVRKNDILHQCDNLPVIHWRKRHQID